MCSRYRLGAVAHRSRREQERELTDRACSSLGQRQVARAVGSFKSGFALSERHSLLLAAKHIDGEYWADTRHVARSFSAEL